MYTVISRFIDMKHNHEYKVGDTYPKDGTEVSEDRISELLSDKNRMNTPLIKEIRKPKKEEPKGLFK